MAHIDIITGVVVLTIQIAKKSTVKIKQNSQYIEITTVNSNFTEE